MTTSRAGSAIGWMVLGFLVGVSASGRATAATDSSSCAGEYIGITGPIVSVIDGPGSAEAEQARWPSHMDGDVNRAYFAGRIIILEDANDYVELDLELVR